MASTPGFEPGPSWWEASALTTAPPLLPSHPQLLLRIRDCDSKITYPVLKALRSAKQAKDHLDPLHPKFD